MACAVCNGPIQYGRGERIGPTTYKQGRLHCTHCGLMYEFDPYKRMKMRGRKLSDEEAKEVRLKLGLDGVEDNS